MGTLVIEQLLGNNETPLPAVVEVSVDARNWRKIADLDARVMHADINESGQFLRIRALSNHDRPIAICEIDIRKRQ